MKKKSLIIGFVVVILLIAFIGIGFLPVIVSTKWGTEYVIKRAGRHLPGQLKIEKWSIHWFDGFECQNVNYNDQENDFNIQISIIRSTEGLWDLIRTKHVVFVQLIDPVVTILPESRDTLLNKGNKPFKQVAQKPKDGVNKKQSTISQHRFDRKEGPAVFLPDLIGHLNIINGSVRMINSKKKQQVVIKDINLEIDTKDPMGPVAYRLVFQSGDGVGSFSAEGVTTASSDILPHILSTEPKLRLSVENWDLEQILSLFSTRGVLPSGNGLLNVEINIEKEREDHLEINGNLNISDLKLEAGFFNKDTPFADDVEIIFNAHRTQGVFALEQFSILSSFVKGNVTGNCKSDKNFRFDGNTVIDLSELFRQLPDTLMLQQGTVLSKAKMDITGRILGEDGKISFIASACIPELKGTRYHKKFSWSLPIILDVEGENEPNGINIREFKLSTPFLKGTGHGNRKDFKARILADLRSGINETKKIISLNQWGGDGRLDFNLHISEWVPGKNKALCQIKIDDFMIHHKENKIFPKHNLNAEFDTKFIFGKDTFIDQLEDFKLNYNAWTGAGKLSVDHIKNDPSDPGIKARGLSFEGNMNLKRLSRILKKIEILPTGMKLKGRVKMAAKGTCSPFEGIFKLKDLSLDSKQFTYRQRKRYFKENQLKFNTQAQIDLKKNDWTFHDLKISSDSGMIQAPELHITNGNNKKTVFKTNALGKFNLKRLIQTGNFLQIPDKMDISGKASLQLEAEFSKEAGQSIKFQGLLSPLTIKTPPGISINKEKVQIEWDMNENKKRDRYKISRFQLDSKPLSISATGKFFHEKKKRLHLKGSVMPDLELLFSYFTGVTDRNITIKGKVKKPFDLKIFLKDMSEKALLDPMVFSSALYADEINAFGMSFQSVEIPVKVFKNRMNMDVKGDVNNGTFSIQPSIKLNKNPLELRIPENSHVFRSVRVTDKLADQLLGRIHPIFKDATISKGFFNLWLNSFIWPTGKANINKASFSGKLKPEGIVISAVGSLRDLMTIIGEDDRKLYILDQEINFVCKNGRIECSPLIANYGDNQMILSGMIGLDGTLVYTAKVPITRDLAGRDLYRLFKGETLDIPIRGTVFEPKIQSDFLKESLLKLKKKALKEETGKLLKKLFE